MQEPTTRQQIQYQQSILEDQLSLEYPIDTVEFGNKKYVRVKDYMYDVNMVLGKGSFGTVYLGYAIEEGKETSDLLKVAIKKILIPTDSRKKQLINKILQSTDTELFALMSLHDNIHILRLYDFVRVQKDEAIYEILEYCDQRDLSTYLKQQRKRHPITELEIRYYFMQILKGFRGLHDKMFLHRDVKPQNILVHDGTLKIADFGFAKRFSEFGEQRTSFAGTMQTAAPQLVLHLGYTDKCDIYSLGVILFWMVYQRYPVEDISTREDYLKPICFPQLPETTEELKTVIRHMLAFQEQQRITWNQLFSHLLFNQEEIIRRFVIKPQVAQQQSRATRLSSMRYTLKRRRIEDALPQRATIWLAQAICLQYQKDQASENCERNLKSHLKFETGKIEFMRMISRKVASYSPEQKSVVSLRLREVEFLRDTIVLAISQMITYTIRRVKQQICLELPSQIFNLEDLEYLKSHPSCSSIVGQVQNQLRSQQQRHRSLFQQDSDRLTASCKDFGLSERLNLVFKPYNLCPKRFQNELKRAIVQLVLVLRPEVVSQSMKPCRNTVLLVHQLFLLFMKDSILSRGDWEKINFNYLFEKEEYNQSVEGFEYIFVKIRQFVLNLVPGS